MVPQRLNNDMLDKHMTIVHKGWRKVSGGGTHNKQLCVTITTGRLHVCERWCGCITSTWGTLASPLCRQLESFRRSGGRRATRTGEARGECLCWAGAEECTEVAVHLACDQDCQTLGEKKGDRSPLSRDLHLISLHCYCIPSLN